MKKYTNEFKVGIFVILCALGLIYLTYSTGKLNIKKDGFFIYAVFNDIAGLTKKAPVMLNGLEVGKVEGINVSYANDKTQIILKLWIDEQVKIRENPTISIKTLGLMGEKYIQIFSSEGKSFIRPETVIAGQPYSDLDAMMASVNTTLEDNKNNISTMVKNLEIASKNFEEFSQDIKRHPWKLLIKTKEKQPKTQAK